MVKDNIENPCSSYDVSVDTITHNGVYVNDKNVDVYDVNVQPQTKDITITENGTYIPIQYETEYFNEVTVDVQPPLQEKTKALGINERAEITPDTDYYGLSKVVVQSPAVPLQNKTLNVTENGSTRLMPDEGYYALHTVDVNVDVNPELESKTIEITDNGQTTIIPDSEYYGLSSVTINTNIQRPLQEKEISMGLNDRKEITPDTDYYGLSKVTVQTPDVPLQYKALNVTENGSTRLMPDVGYYALHYVDVNVDVNPELESKTIDITSNGTMNITPDSAYGLSSVTVNTNVQPALQEKVVPLGINERAEITPDAGYYGLSKVVAQSPDVPLQNKTLNITENGSTRLMPDEGYYALHTVDVNVDVHQPTLGSKEVTITQNGTTNILPDSGVEGLSNVTVNTNVQPELQIKNLVITENTQTDIRPDDGYDGLRSVTVFTQIKRPLQQKELPIGLNERLEVTPDTNYYGLSKVVVQSPDVPLQSKNITITENSSINVSPDEGYYALSNVNVNVEVPRPTLQNKEVTITGNGSTTITKDDGYDGLGNVTVNTNIKPNAIGNFISTAKTGTFTGTICGRVIDENVVADISNLNTTGITTLLLDDYLKNADTLIANNIIFSSNNRENVFFYQNNLGKIKHLIAHNFTTNMGDYWTLFGNNTNIETIDLTDWKYKSICGEMFQGSNNLKEVNLTNWDFPNIQHVNQMFNNCSKLENVILPQPLNLNKVIGAYNMFSNTGLCLINGDSKINIKYGSTLENCSEMFAYNNGLKEIYMTPITTSNGSGVNVQNIFYQTNNLEKFSLANIKVNADTNCLTSGGKLKWVDLSGSNYELSNVPSTTYGAVRISNNSEDNLVTIIGDHTLQEVENGTIKAFIDFGKNGSDVLALQHPRLRYSSLLAVFNGLNLIRLIVGENTHKIILSKTAWNNMYNDDDTRPNSDTILSRQTTLQNLANSKRWIINKDYE